MKKFFWMLVFGVAVNSFVIADDFDFKDPKGINSVSLKLDSPLEPINGIASGISGKVSFDGKDGKSLKGELDLTVDSIRMPSDDMAKYLKGEMWMDAAKFPNIKVSLKEVVESTSTTPNEFNIKAKVMVEIKGIAKELVVDIKATYLVDKLGERVQKQKGDLLVLRTVFSVKRDEFNINPGKMPLVANEIVVTVNLIGACVK